MNLLEAFLEINLKRVNQKISKESKMIRPAPDKKEKKHFENS